MFCNMGFSGGARGKERLHANAGGLRDAGSIPGLGRSPGGRNGNPLQHSCLEKFHGGTWRARVHRIAESDMTEMTYRTHTIMCSNTILLEVQGKDSKMQNIKKETCILIIESRH